MNMTAILIIAESVIHDEKERFKDEVIHVEEVVARWFVHHGFG